MNGLTVKDLLTYLIKENDAGHGDYKIFVTDDGEANGYHALWFIGQTAEQLRKDDPENLKYVEESNHDLSILKGHTDKAIYLG